MNLEGMKEKYGLKAVCIQSGAQLCGHAKRLFAKNPGELQRERSQESGLDKTITGNNQLSTGVDNRP